MKYISTRGFEGKFTAQEAIIKSWRLDEGYHTFLIDASGEITAVDPDEQMLRSVR